MDAARLGKGAAVAVDDDARAEAFRPREDPRQHVLQAQARHAFLAQLHQNLLERRARGELLDPPVDAHVGGVGNDHERGKRERGENRRVGGEHRGNVGRFSALPADRLVLERLRLAFPRGDAKEMQPHRRMGIRIDARDPGRGGGDGDAELFGELAAERGARILARLDLSAGKFPVAGIRLALGALREQERAVGPLDHGRGDFGECGARRHFPAVENGARHHFTVLHRFFLPAQSRANCHATRPEREPRSSAQRSAALRDASSGLPPSVRTQWSAMSRY